MQVNDFKNIQEAIKYEVLQDEKEYLKLLKVIGTMCLGKQPKTY